MKSKIQNKKILHIHVPMSKSVHTLNGKIYDRNNDSDINITGQNANIAKLYLLKQDIHTEDKIFPFATMDDFDLELIKRIRIVASDRRTDTHPWEGLSDFELLKSSGLYKVDKTTNKEGFTLGAILLFGKDETITNALPHHKTDLILRKVNLAYEIKVSHIQDLPKNQHNEYIWLSLDELMNSSLVHKYVKDYFNIKEER